MHHSNIVCLSCGERHPKGTLYSCNKCGGILDAEYNYDEISVEKVLQKFQKGRSIWRFRDLLPVGDDVRPVSLGEGNTPLLHADKIGHILGMSNIFLKDESRNPTGSFKDLAIHEGVWVEPSSSTVIAALPKILAEGLVDKDETKVCVLTGSGLKDMKTAKLIVQQTEIVEKEVEKIISAFEKYYPYRVDEKRHM